MNWHACGKSFDTGKTALNLKMAFHFYQEKSLTNATKFYLRFKNALLPITLLRLDDWLGKKEHRFEGSVGKMAVKLSLLKRDETSWDAAALWAILADENGPQRKNAHSVDLLFSFCPLRQKLS